MNKLNDVGRARKAVNARIGFYIHLTAFLVVNAVLIFINLSTSSGHLWFQWPLLGWGIGIAAHAIATFGFPGMPGVRGRMIAKELRKQGSND